jgi:pimeloyl-ACP methyl ester carboxylesterase
MSTVLTKEGFNLNYEVHGQAGKPAIILSHGNGNSLSDWKSLGYVEKLSPNFQLILMDALGYGDSDKPLDQNQYTPERRAADVISVLDHLHIPKAHFFGNSIGGSLGFVLADLYQDRFLSFIIASAHPYGSTQPIGSNLFGEDFRTCLNTEGMQGFVTDLESRFLGRPFDPRVRSRYLQNNPHSLAIANTPLWPDRSSSLKYIQVPVLLFAGELDPVHQYLSEIKSQIPNCRTEILANTDHCDAYWDSSKAAPLIESFIKINQLLHRLVRI